MNTEILNQIQILNEHAESLTQKIQDLNSILKHTQGLDFNTIITILAGLFGVIIGSCISYYFSKKITNESSKARFAIQRKNLIYSKIYKELTYMREQIDLLPKDGFYFQIKTNLVDTYVNLGNWGNNYWIAGKHNYIAPEFYVWKDIKSDIRITQVNNEVLIAMEALEESIIKYFNSTNNFTKEIEKNVNDNQLLHGISNISNSTNFFFDDFNKEDFIDLVLKGRQAGWADDKKEPLSKIIDMTLEKPYLKESSENFILLKEKANKAYFVLEKLIKDIVNKYEYGEEI